MARGSFAANMLRGKAGIYVFYRSKGQQLMRTYNDKPMDAKTRAQGTQRSQLTNIIRVYQSSTSFFKSAFENKPTKWSDYNAMVSANLGSNPRIYIPKEMAEAGGGVVAPYIISDGTLQSIIIQGEGVDAVTNIALGTDLVIDDSTTVGVFSQAVLANNTFIQAGDQLSYVSIEQYTADSYPALRGRKYEVTLDPNSNELLLDYLPAQGVANISGWLGHGELVYSGAFAWVLSRNTPQGLKVSRQRLIVTSTTLYASYADESAITRAVDSYKDTNDVFLNPGQTSSGSSVPSTLPSVSTVLLNGSTLSTGDGAVELDSPESIAAMQLDINGSALAGVTSVSLSVTGGDTSDSSDVTVTVNVPMTASGEVRLSNTDAITLDGITYISQLSISVSGRRIYSWKASTQSGGQIEDPLG